MTVSGTLRSERDVTISRHYAGMAHGDPERRSLGSEVNRAGDRVTAVIQDDLVKVEAAVDEGGAHLTLTDENGTTLLQYPPPFKIVCAWCDTVLVFAPSPTPISHGICPPCVERVTGSAPVDSPIPSRSTNAETPHDAAR